MAEAEYEAQYAEAQAEAQARAQTMFGQRFRPFPRSFRYNFSPAEQVPQAQSSSLQLRHCVEAAASATPLDRRQGAA